VLFRRVPRYGAEVDRGLVAKAHRALAQRLNYPRGPPAAPAATASPRAGRALAPPTPGRGSSNPFGPPPSPGKAVFNAAFGPAFFVKQTSGDLAERKAPVRQASGGGFEAPKEGGKNLGPRGRYAGNKGWYGGLE
jgi:hypothetical protein